MVFRKFLSYFEDPKYPSVGPHIRLLSLTGLWHQSNSKIEKVKLYLFYLTVAFFCSQYIRCLMKFDAESLTLILQYAPFHMGIVKSCCFQKDYKKWENVIFYVSSLERDQLLKKNEQSVEITKYIKQSRRVTYFFWALAFFSNFSIFSEPYRKNHENEDGNKIYTQIFDGFIPYSSEAPGYYVSMAIQTVLGHIISAYVVAWDTLVVTIMIFFTGQLKVARINCRNIIKNGEGHENIVSCHRHHTKLVKYQKLFNELISQVMFVYLVVISVNLGVCIIQVAELQDDITALISSCQFVIACLIQLLLFYWHANEVTTESVLVSYSTFESNWTEAPASVQKEVALLGITTNKRLVFRAGPFNEMSLRTFIAVRFSAPVTASTLY
ncbi:odorant receptor 49b isoform X2 [Plodia interpunctella]|uniref:odorant receptor 49b isoform X2 n=1 Tax=Plodia interpunctella TaxID=58824 RepID=UPI0023674AA3|nr:odorant receptor 49b-like isoform X2 [Plodia interpunctella]